MSDWEQRVQDTIQTVREYIPEYVLAHTDKEKYTPKDLEEYHPVSSVYSFREDLLSILMYGRLGGGPVDLKEERRI